MKVVKVYGALREKLGQCRFEFVAETPAQALRALLSNFPGLDRWLIDSEKDGVAYRVTVGKEKVHHEDVSNLFLPWSEREVFSITPVLMGAGDATSQIFAGIAIVALSIVTGGIASIGVSLGGFLGIGTVATAGVLIGTSLILSGVASLLSPQPTFNNVGIRDQDEARFESFGFSGIVNTTRQGLPVPVVYGRTFVGSAVISAGLDTDDL